MHELPKRLESLARELGTLIATETFARALNPKHRGSCWKWGEFVEIAVANAQGCRRAYSAEDCEQWWPQLKEVAGNSARITSENLMQESSISDWWSNPIE